MDITTEQAGTVVTVALSGRLDAATSKSVEEHLLDAIAKGAQGLVIDLQRLDYISSVGLRVFIVAGKRMKATNGRLVVCALKPEIAQVFTIAGFMNLFPIFGTRSEAVSHFS